MFSASFPGFLRVRKVRKILDVFEVFLGIFKKTKEKKDRVVLSQMRLSEGMPLKACANPQARDQNINRASRLSFLLQNPRTPEGFLKGF